MKKTINDLRETLFDTIELVKANKITSDKAKIVGELAQTIINSAKTENEFMKISKQKGSGFIGNPSHQIDAPKGKQEDKIPKRDNKPYEFRKPLSMQFD